MNQRIHATILSMLILITISLILFGLDLEKASGFLSKESVITNIKIEPEYTSTKPGETILLTITIIQLDYQERRDITVDFYIKNNEEKLFLSSETLAIHTKVSLVEELSIPQGLKDKSYEIFVEVKDTKTQELISTASQRIIIIDSLKITIDREDIIYISIFFIVTFTLSLIILYQKLNKNKKILEENRSLLEKIRKRNF